MTARTVAAGVAAVSAALASTAPKLAPRWRGLMPPGAALLNVADNRADRRGRGQYTGGRVVAHASRTRRSHRLQLRIAAALANLEKDTTS